MLHDFNFCDYFNEFYTSVKEDYSLKRKDKVSKHLKKLNRQMQNILNETSIKHYDVDLRHEEENVVICIKCYNRCNHIIYSYVRYFDY